jgi:hypothetical protein
MMRGITFQNFHDLRLTGKIFQANGDFLIDGADPDGARIV